MGYENTRTFFGASLGGQLVAFAVGVTAIRRCTTGETDCMKKPQASARRVDADIVYPGNMYGCCTWTLLRMSVGWLTI
jgi:hypothetical protein